MKQTTNVKKAEKGILIVIITFFNFLRKIIISFFQFLIKISTQTVTIMFIPHSEKKVFNFRINTFIVFLIPTITITAITLISFWTASNVKKSKEFKYAIETTNSYQKQTREYQKLLNEVLESHSEFKNKLDKLLLKLDKTKILEMQRNNNYKLSQGGALNAVDIAELNEFDIEKAMVQRLLIDYEYSKSAFSEITKKADTYNELLKNLPFGSPVRGPYVITSGFGLRIHPIKKVLDMHQGIDLAHQLGTPIIATAPGIVEKVDWSPFGYGWYCRVSHKMGFSTLYAHMRSRPVVNPGDKVGKGTLLGYMGMTGAATGSHVHYEIRLGDNLLDPLKFITIY